MNIGTLIYNRRKELGLTLEQVGDYVGVSKSTVKKWESGYISNMRRDKIALLAKILQINPTELVGDNTDLPADEPALSEKQKQLLSMYEALPEDKKELVDSLLKSLLNG